VDWLRRNAIPVRSIDPADEDFSDLQPLKRILGDSRIVMLGEQSHKDGATFRAKVRLIKFLHREMGFGVLAFESGLYDCAKAWELLKGGEDPLRAAQRGVFAIWSRSEQVAPLFEYLGRQARSESPLELAGFDNQATGTASSDFLLTDLERLLDASGIQTGGDWPKFKQGLRTLTSFEETKPPDAEVQRAFGKVLAAAAAGLRKRPSSPEAAFWLQVIESERTFAEMTWRLANDDRAAKNLRDEQMARNLLWLARVRYPGKKIIVWAATYHEVRNPEALEPLADLPPTFYRGVKTMGDEVWKVLRGQVYTLGFTAYDGEFGRPGRSTRLVPAREGSLEDLLNRAGHPFAIVDLRKPAPGGEWLRRKLVARPLGYTDMQADWTRVVDGMVFTRTMTPSHLLPPKESPSPGRR
jgi:erythromycin esterase